MITSACGCRKGPPQKAQGRAGTQWTGFSSKVCAFRPITWTSFPISPAYLMALPSKENSLSW